MVSKNFITNVAIVGAGGNLGHHITEALMRTGRHTITAITRADTKSTFPDDIKTATVDYTQPSTLVAALKGQDCLIVTLGFFAAPDTQDLLITAAAEAGVPWILPNEWSPDTANQALVRDISSLHAKPLARQKIQELGVSSYVGVCCGLWYEWCLATLVLFGIDSSKREATLFDDGETKISTSTLPQVGRAVAALLNLSLSDGNNNSTSTLSLDNFENKLAYISSFNISQKDMLESVYRVTGTTQQDWKINHEPALARYQHAVEATDRGDRTEGRKRYTRVFFKNGGGSFEDQTSNVALSLPSEDLDEATRVAIQMREDNET